MAESHQLTEQQELALIEKVDLRIVLANTDEELERNLDIFFPALLLKLASPHAAARQAVFGSIKNVMSRINSLQQVRLPVEKLLKQAKRPQLPENQDGFSVRLYSLLFASKGIDRMSQEGKRLLIPMVIDDLSDLPRPLAARMFHILCKLLLSWDASVERFQHPAEVKKFLDIKKTDDIQYLLEKFAQFFLLIPLKSEPTANNIPRGYSCPGLSVSQVEFFTYDAGLTFSKEQLLRYKTCILRFATSGFADEDPSLIRFLLVASADDSGLSDHALTILKRQQIPRENETFIASIMGLYIGDRDIGIPPVNHLLQEKIISVLNNSIVATKDARSVSLISSIGLNSSSYKLRSLTLLFVQHIYKYNYESLKENTSNDYSINVAALIRNNLHAEGWPKLHLNSSVPNFALGIEQRRSQYETLGQILKKDLSLILDLSFIEFLMDSLKGDLSEFRPTIQEALSSLAPYLSCLPKSSKDKIKIMARKILSDNYELENADKSTREAIMCTRYIAIKFLNAAFSFDDVEARFDNILGTSTTNRYDIVEESLKGLHPYWFSLNQASNSQKIQEDTKSLLSLEKETKFPSFECFLGHLLEELTKSRDNESATLKTCLNTAVKFCFQILISQASYGKKTVVVQDENWLLRVENAVQVDEQISSGVGQEINRLDEKLYFEFLSVLVNEFVRRDEHNQYIAVSAIPDENYGSTLLFFLNHTTEVRLCLVDFLIPKIFNFLSTYKTSSDSDIQNAANILGIIASHSKNISYINLITENIDLSLDSQTIIPSLYACGYLMPRLFLTRAQDVYNCQSFMEFPTRLIDFIPQQKCRTAALCGLCEVLKFGALTVVPEKTRKEVLLEFISILKPILMVDQLAVMAWSYLSLYSSDSDIYETLYDGLVETHTTKQVDLLFTVGEALTVLAGGWRSKYLSNQTHLSNFQSAERLKSISTNEQITKSLSRLLEICKTVKPSLRKASCIWLLSFVQYLGHEQIVKERGKEIHLLFITFLADRDEFVQDSASRGLSLVYESSGKELQDEMVRGLLKGFTDSKSAMALSSGTVSGETQLFEPGVLNTGDGSISTYQDIMNLASEVGDPSLVYKFLSLSKSSTLWSSRKGIAFGLGAILSKSSLEDMLKQNSQLSQKLIPKLYRYRFDPYQGVSSAMNEIWNSLVKNPAEVVKQNFDEILQELLTGMGNKDWRVREASAAALSELLEVVPQEKFEAHLEELWTMSFRSIDDIKESVRKAGTRLTRILAGILMKSVNSEYATTTKTEKTLKVLLPFLIGHKGLNSDSEDVRKFALETLMKMIKTSSPVLKPFAPTLVYELTLLLSALEPQVVNYLTLNADKYNVNSSLLDAKRAQGVNDSPILRSVESMVETCDENRLEELVESVVRATKKSVGLPSKVASARLLCVLVLQHTASLGPYAGKLLKVSFSGMSDRNCSVGASYANAFGYVCKIAKTNRMVKYATKLVEKYFSSDDESLKKVVGLAVDSMQKHAPEQFEIVSTILMPLIFIAKNGQEETAELYTKVWNEASRTGAGTVKLYIHEITMLVSQHIKSSTFLLRLSCAKSICQVCKNLDLTTNEKDVLELFEILVEASGGRTWSGKEMIVKALVSLAVFYEQLYSKNATLKSSVESVLSKEVSRNNKTYVGKVVFDLGDYLKTFPKLDLYALLLKVSYSLLEKIDNGEIADSDDENNPSSKKVKVSSDVTKKSSKENVSNEEFKIALLKKCAESLGSLNENNFPMELFNFIVESSVNLFTSKNVVHTWRSQIAISDVGVLLLDDISSNLKSQLQSKFLILWERAFEEGSRPDAIDNVQIQMIKFGKKLKEGFPSLKLIIDNELANLMEVDRSPIVVVELRNAGISP